MTRKGSSAKSIRSPKRLANSARQTSLAALRKEFGVGELPTSAGEMAQVSRTPEQQQGGSKERR